MFIEMDSADFHLASTTTNCFADRFASSPMKHFHIFKPRWETLHSPWVSLTFQSDWSTATNWQSWQSLKLLAKEIKLHNRFFKRSRTFIKFGELPNTENRTNHWSLVWIRVRLKILSATCFMFVVWYHSNLPLRMLLQFSFKPFSKKNAF